MRVLYHMWLSPECRKVRIALAEKELDVELKAEKVWQRREAFLKMNPTGEVPVLVEPDGTILADSTAIVEYIEETCPHPALLPGPAPERAEARRVAAWFDIKCNREVSSLLISEKIMKRFMQMGEPSSEAIRCGLKNLKTHLDYVGFLAERRNYLAGSRFSLADIAAVSHISVLDYLGDIDWGEYPSAKDWYMRVKSRKSMRGILADRVPGLAPPRHYSKLDF